MAHRFFSYLLKNQIILALFLIAGGWLVFQTRGILTSIFLAFIINAALLPLVRILRIRGVPNVLATLIPFASITVIIFLIVFPLIPFVASQVSSLLIDLPQSLKQAGNMLGISIDAKAIQEIITNEIDTIGKNAFSVTSKVFGGLFSTLTVLVVSFYLVLYHDRFKQNIAHLFHRNDRPRVIETLGHIDEKLGAWLRGQMLLSLFIGIITWIILSILGVPFAVPLAILAGMLEIVPTLGPILASIPAIIIALTVSPTLGLIVAASYILIQAVENYVLVPKIMQRAVGLNPVIIIIAVMIGANLMGILGALLSIPFVSFVIVLFNSLTAEEDK